MGPRSTAPPKKCQLLLTPLGRKSAPTPIQLRRAEDGARAGEFGERRTHALPTPFAFGAQDGVGDYMPGAPGDAALGSGCILH